MKIVIVVFLLALFSLTGCGVYRNRSPRSIGIHEEKLTPCPSTPNCVSSYSTDPIHSIAPFPIVNSSIDIIAKIIEELPRTKIIKKNDKYLYAEFRSKIFSFVDDVEFLVHEDQNIIHVRSASRVGYGDWGVNRDRIELIRSRYIKKTEK